jgi:hypothetical protein
VTNNNDCIKKLQSDQSVSASLELIKESSEKLFAFNQVFIVTGNDHELHADAEFLFIHLARLEIEIVPDKKGDFQKESGEKLMESFIKNAKRGQLEFIGLTLDNQNYQYGPKFLGSSDCYMKLNSLTLKKVDMRTGDKLLILFSEKSGRQVEWPKLSKLKIIDCNITYLDALIFDIFPNLHELILENNEITQFNKNAFKRASNLLELVVSSEKSCLEHRLLSMNECFQGLTNLRVLQLDHFVIESFDVLNCLHSLIELKVIDRHLKKIEKFDVAIPGLKKLTLELMEVNYISPNVFDHLTSIEYLEITCRQVNERFETSLTPRVIKVYGSKLVKLNSVDLSKIEEIGFSEQMECGDGSVTLNKLKRVTIKENGSLLSVNNNSFQQFSHLEDLKLTIYSLSSVPSGQLNSLTELKDIDILFRYSRMLLLFRFFNCLLLNLI